MVADALPAEAGAMRVSPESPVYYEPVWVGFRDLGVAVAGEKIPPAEKIKALLVEALRHKGYIESTPERPAPSLLIFFSWGTLNPDVVSSPGDGGMDETTSFNTAQMLAFLGAHKVAKQPSFSTDTERLVEAVKEDHYFLVVAAYDRSSMFARKRRMLWMTRIATESRRVWLHDTLPAMVAAGTELFGEDADRPVWVDPRSRRKTSVEVGPLQVLEYQEKRQDLPKEETPR